MPSRDKRPDPFDKAPRPTLSPAEIVLIAVVGMTVIAAIMVALGLRSAIQNLSELT